ncbi:MAG: DNA primase [Bacteroidaceae bacterium]|nr:DNA primase [Bacteroidaceae bacterium]
MIDQATIDKILDAAQIVDVVSEFVTLKRAGVNYKGLCPFHNEKTPSFVVSPSKGLCKCFSCGKGGNVVHFIMEHEQLNYYEALKWLANKYHIEVKERELSDEEKQAQNVRESMFVVNDFANNYFQNLLHNHIDGQSIGLAYFRQRGFRDDIIRKFQLGYSLNERNALAKEAKRKGFKEEFLEKTGLCYRRDNDGQLRDRFWGRVMFPVHTLSGKVIAFGGRVLKTDGKVAKYVNSPESEIYHKSNELYGIYFAKQAIVRDDRCFLVEGYTDVISMHQAGIENVVASSGTSLTSGQIRLIHRFTNNITVLYDGDGAGIKASIRGIDMLLEEGMNIKVVLLPDGEDPDSFARKHNATDYKAYINSHEVDFIRFKTNLLLEEVGNDPIKRAGLIGDIVRSISVIPENIVRSVYIRECSQLLQVEEKLLVQEVGKLMMRTKEEKQAAAEKQRQREAAKAGRAQQNVPVPDGEVPLELLGSQAPPPMEGLDAPPPPMDEGGGVSMPPPAPFPSEGVEGSTNDRVGHPTPLPWEGQGEGPLVEGPLVETLFIPSQNKQKKAYHDKEVLLMQQVVRYGERVMYAEEDEDGNSRNVTVAEHVASDLSVDSLELQDPMHRRMLDEVMQRIHNEGFVASRYFFSHPDPQVARLAADLSSDRYQLSKYHSRSQKIVTDEERLCELVPHLLTDLKLAIVEDELKQVLAALQDRTIMTDAARYMEVMKRYKDLSEVQRAIAKRAGDRVVLS